MRHQPLAFFLCVSLLLGGAPAAFGASFTDVSGHYAEQAVEEARLNQWIDGYPDGSFKPDATITRAEFVKMMLTATKLFPESDMAQFFSSQPRAYTDDQPFRDMTSHWLCTQGWLLTALNAGLLVASDYADGNLNPDVPIRRYEMALLATRALGLVFPAQERKEQLPSFSDAEEIAPWVRGYIVEATNAGILKGYEDGSFGSDRTATRAEAVTIVSRVAAYMQAGRDETLTVSLNIPAFPGGPPSERFVPMQQVRVIDGYVYIGIHEAMQALHSALMTSEPLPMGWTPVDQTVYLAYGSVDPCITAGSGYFGYTGVPARNPEHYFPTPARMCNWNMMIPIYHLDRRETYWLWPCEFVSDGLIVYGTLPERRSS